MTVSILIVGQYDVLTHSRAQLLGEWKTSPVDLAGAWVAINILPYDVVIFCQTISDDQALQLAARAAIANPDVKTLAIGHAGLPRGAELNQSKVEFAHPSQLREEAVAALLG